MPKKLPTSFSLIATLAASILVLSVMDVLAQEFGHDTFPDDPPKSGPPGVIHIQPRISDGGSGGSGGSGGGGGGGPLVLPDFPEELIEKEECPPGSNRECVPPREQRHGDD